MTRTLLLATTAASLLVGCTKDGETDSGGWDADNMPYCEDTASAMAPEDESAFGLSGQAFLDHIPAQLDGTAVFSDSQEADLAVQVTVDAASLRTVDSVAVYPETDGPSPAIAVICPARVEVDAVVSVQTADGRLAEVQEVVLSAVDPAESGIPAEQVAFSVALDPDALGGSLSMGDFTDPAAWDAITMSMWGTFQDGALSGEVSAMGEVVQGSMATASVIPIASLAAVAAE